MDEMFGFLERAWWTLVLIWIMGLFIMKAWSISETAFDEIVKQFRNDPEWHDNDSKNWLLIICYGISIAASTSGVVIIFDAILVSILRAL